MPWWLLLACGCTVTELSCISHTRSLRRTGHGLRVRQQFIFPADLCATRYSSIGCVFVIFSFRFLSVVFSFCTGNRRMSLLYPAILSTFLKPEAWEPSLPCSSSCLPFDFNSWLLSKFILLFPSPQCSSNTPFLSPRVLDHFIDFRVVSLLASCTLLPF